MFSVLIFEIFATEQRLFFSKLNSKCLFKIPSRALFPWCLSTLVLLDKNGRRKESPEAQSR